MKTLDAAQIMDLAGTLVPLSMLAGIAMAVIRFIRTYMEVCAKVYAEYVQPDLNCPYARERVFSKSTHDHKYAVFTGSPDGRWLFGFKKGNKAWEVQNFLA